MQSGIDWGTNIVDMAALVLGDRKIGCISAQVVHLGNRNALVTLQIVTHWQKKMYMNREDRSLL
jgi:hypothetical protein